jgi:hypothetical protein
VVLKFATEPEWEVMHHGWAEDRTDGRSAWWATEYGPHSRAEPVHQAGAHSRLQMGTLMTAHTSEETRSLHLR